MFESSKDVLYIVISFCIIWVAVFLCWMFYYAGKILKNTNQIIEEFRVRLQSLADAIGYIQEKVEFMSLAMNSVFKGVGNTIKDAAIKKAKKWVEKKTDNCEEAAKEAVEKAVEEAGKKIKKITKNIEER
jgi:hydrogenase maturation factor HypE